jgi:hypothetical protein
MLGVGCSLLDVRAHRARGAFCISGNSFKVWTRLHSGIRELVALGREVVND